MVTNDEFRKALGLDRVDGGWKRSGKVSSVSSDGGLVVDFGGPGDGTRCEKWCSASEGDVVLVEGVGHRALATAVLGGGPAGSGGGGTYTAGEGIVISGSVISAEVTGEDVEAIPTSWIENLS